MEQRPRRRTPAKKKKSIFQYEWVRTLLFYILPFVVINLVIFFLATTRPSYALDVADTADYRTTELTFTITSRMPLKSVTITLDGQPLDLTQAGKRSYKATIVQNGVLEIHMENFNGMAITGYEVIDILDKESPDVISYSVNEGLLTLTLSDTQSGIDYDHLTATTSDGRIITPVSINRESGIVIFQMDPNGLAVSILDMSGNEYLPSFSLTQIDEAENSSQEVVVE